jgi:hypothetical protein
MGDDDKRPNLRHGIQRRTVELANMVQKHNNRFGTVLVAFHRFLCAVQNIRMSQPGSPRDAYTCILFNQEASVRPPYLVPLALNLYRPQLFTT